MQMYQRLLALGLATFAAIPGVAIAQNLDRTAPLDFQGRYLVSISDADMLASAYVDSQLGPREGEDALSVIPLAGNYREQQAYEVNVSNSVAGPPTAVAVSPDGRWAFVVETFAPAPANGKVFSDLPIGNKLTVVDLSQPTAPRVHTSINVGNRPQSITINPDGNMLAIALHAPAPEQLVLVPFANGKLGEPSRHAIPNFPKGEQVVHVEWHPSGRYLAAVMGNANKVAFLQVQQASGKTRVQSWGDAVAVGKYPFIARFTPDGRHLLVNNLYWGNDIDGFWIEAPRGDIMSIRFTTERSPDGKLRHSVISQAQTGVSPEGFTISPDGTLVVTTNLERSYLPYNDPRITWFSSLTLIKLNPQTGHLESVGDYLYDGILPEAATFDASGKYVAVVTYDHFDDRRPGGSVDFWRIVSDPINPTPRLVKTNHSVPVTRGAHSMVLVP